MKWYAVFLGLLVVFFVLAKSIPGTFAITETSLFLTVVGLIYGLFAAFTITNVWGKFAEIRDRVGEETAGLVNVFLLSKSFSNKKITGLFYEKIRNYCNHVARLKWEEYLNDEPQKKFNEIFEILNTMKFESGKDSSVYSSVSNEIIRSSVAREHELILISNPLSISRWALLMFLSSIFLIGLYFTTFSMDLAVFIKTTMSAAMVLILFVIYDVDKLKYKFKEVSVEPYYNVIKILELSK